MQMHVCKARRKIVRSVPVVEDVRVREHELVRFLEEALEPKIAARRVRERERKDACGVVACEKGLPAIASLRGDDRRGRRMIEQGADRDRAHERHVASDGDDPLFLRMFEERKEPGERTFRARVVGENDELLFRVGVVLPDEDTVTTGGLEHTTRACDDRLAFDAKRALGDAPEPSSHSANEDARDRHATLAIAPSLSQKQRVCQRRLAGVRHARYAL